MCPEFEEITKFLKTEIDRCNKKIDDPEKYIAYERKLDELKKFHDQITKTIKVFLNHDISWVVRNTLLFFTDFTNKEIIQCCKPLINLSKKINMTDRMKQVSFESEFIEWICAGQQKNPGILFCPEEIFTPSEISQIMMIREKNNILPLLKEWAELRTSLVSVSESTTVMNHALKKGRTCYLTTVDHLDRIISDQEQRIKGKRKEFLKEKEEIDLCYQKMKKRKPGVITREEVESLGIAQYPDDLYVYELLKRIICYNNQVIAEKLQEATELNKETKIYPIERTLLQLGFPVSNLSKDQREQLLTYGKPEVLDELIPMLLEPPFKELLEPSSYLIDFLLGTTKERLETIRKMHEMAAVRTYFIKDHPEIWIAPEEELDGYIPTRPSAADQFENNVHLLKESKVDLQNLFAKEILLYPTVQLQNTITTLKKYYKMGFKANESEASLKVLQNPQLFDLIDQYIEIGLFDYAIEKPRIIDQKHLHTEKTKDSYDPLVERYCFCREYGLPLINKGGRLDTMISSGKGFYCSREQLFADLWPDATSEIDSQHLQVLETNDRMKISPTTLRDPYILELENNNKTDALHYQFEDTVISRPKVLRNYECLKKNLSAPSPVLLMSAIFYRTYLDIDQVKEIKDQVQGKYLEKK